MTRNKQLVINMSANFVAYFASIIINFFLSPYIVENIGVDAYGFVGLANNFISYASLITIAINSMCGRFVTVSIYKKDMEAANEYFSSVFIANFLLAACMAMFFMITLFNLEKIITVPVHIALDVKILFTALFLNCLIGTLGSVFSIATFATNKLYLNSIRQIESNLLKLVLIVFLFLAFSPKLSYLGITTLLTGVYVLIFDVFYTKKLLPDIHITYTKFNIKRILNIVSSGVWNLINRLGQLLLDGLDLLITNLFISATSMGILSLAKTVPSLITTLVGSVTGVFSPDFTILYAEEKFDELLLKIKQAMKIMGVISNLPIIILIACGDLFFSIWQPTQDASQLHILSILTCAGLIFNGSINCIYNVFTVVNKLKLSSLLVCLTGGLSVLITFILLKTTNWGLYAVAGVSVCLATVRNLLFTVPYGAHCLKQKWYTFYPTVIRGVSFVVICSAVGICIKNNIKVSGWIDLIFVASIVLVVSVVIGAFIILSKNDRKYVYNVIRKRMIK